MSYTREQIDENAAFFRMKLQAVKSSAEVDAWVKGEGGGDFILADVRGRPAFEKGHIKGAICLPMEEIDARQSELTRDREVVVYCWNHL